MKKGFTLIELLAVIVILAIIALIATPIILGIINDAREESNERSVELYASAVRNGIAAYQLRTGNEVLPGTYNESKPLPFEVEYDGKVDCENVIITETGKVSLDKCTVNGGTKEYSYGIEEDETPDNGDIPEVEEPSAEKVCTIEKQDASKYSIGDVVTCNIGETPDKFYVIEEAELSVSAIQMLTEINIDPTEYRQTTLDGSIEFSTSGYWVDENYELLSQYGSSYPAYVYNSNSLLYPRVNEYVNYLNTKLTGATGSLLTYSQAKTLGCDDSVGNCSGAPSWVYSTLYWTGSASDANNVWIVSSYGSAFETYNSVFGLVGVRPVITISTSDIQK